MNKQTQEALKMAIEALDFAKKIGYQSPSIDALQACKEALEQPAQTYIVNNTAGTQFRLYEQPAQEPVEVYGILDDGDYVSVEATKEGAIKQCEFMNKHDCNCTYKPLYIHPHQWQGLTDEHLLGQLFGIRFQRHTENLMSNPPQIKYSYTIQESDLIKFARAIEQALKEKNHV
jgi:hypothetical protein